MQGHQGREGLSRGSPRGPGTCRKGDWSDFTGLRSNVGSGTRSSVASQSQQRRRGRLRVKCQVELQLAIISALSNSVHSASEGTNMAVTSHIILPTSANPAGLAFKPHPESCQLQFLCSVFGKCGILKRPFKTIVAMAEFSYDNRCSSGPLVRPSPALWEPTGYNVGPLTILSALPNPFHSLPYFVLRDRERGKGE